MTAAATDLSPDEGITAGSLSIQQSGRRAARGVRGGARPLPRHRRGEARCAQGGSGRRRRPDHRSRRRRLPATGSWPTRRCWTGRPAVAPNQAGVGVPRRRHRCGTNRPAGQAHRAAALRARSAVRRHGVRPGGAAAVAGRDAHRSSTSARPATAGCRHRGARRRLPRRGRRTRGGRAAGGGAAAGRRRLGSEPVAAGRGRPARVPDRGACRHHGPRRTDHRRSQTAHLSSSATYHRPFIAHGSIAPSCAVALATETARCRSGRTARACTTCAGRSRASWECAGAVGGPPRRGRRAATATTAPTTPRWTRHCSALAVPGRPVQVVWSRADELAWAPLGSAGVVRISAETARRRRRAVLAARDLERQLHQPPRHDAAAGIPRHQPPRPHRDPLRRRAAAGARGRHEAQCRCRATTFRRMRWSIT